MILKNFSKPIKLPKLKSHLMKNSSTIVAPISKLKRLNVPTKSLPSKNYWSTNSKNKSLTWKIFSQNLKKLINKLSDLMVQKLSAKSSASILERISMKSTSCVCWYRRKEKARSREFTKLSKSSSKSWKVPLNKRNKSWDFLKIGQITCFKTLKKSRTEPRQIILLLRRSFESIRTT